jgi:ribosome biogenesis GTPase / thiamine phosphate phosphatase
MSFDLALLGWDDARLAELADLESQHGDGLLPGRVARVDRAALTVLTSNGQVRAGASGRLFHDSAVMDDAAPTPTVGDWVALDGTVAVAVLARRSAFERGTASGEARAQVLAANIDTLCVVTPLVGRPRPRLVQRCLALAWQSGAQPVVLGTKLDLCPDVDTRLAEMTAAAIGVDVHAVSATRGDGLAALERYLAPGRTVAMIGPSGAGKSTLANAFGAGTVALATAAVRERRLGAAHHDRPPARGASGWRRRDRHSRPAQPRPVG